MYRQDGPEAGRSLGETEFVARQAAMSDSGSFGNTRACTVMFGNVDITIGDKIEPLFDRHMEWSGGRYAIRQDETRTSASGMLPRTRACW